MLEQLQQQSRDASKRSQDMGKRQDDLQKKLNEILKKAQELGLDPSKLGEAGGEMDSSSRRLYWDDPESSVPNQNNAIQKLREGQQDLQKQMQGQPGGGSLQQGQNTRDDKSDPSRSPSAPADELQVDPNKAGNRTRATRDEIRRRLDNPGVTESEREYLQRLLKGDNGGKAPAPSPN
jgi:hypothetical protein